MNWWIPGLVAWLIGCVLVARWCYQRARLNGELRKFRAALNEVETEVGKAFLPVIETVCVRLSHWLDRSKPSTPNGR